MRKRSRREHHPSSKNHGSQVGVRLVLMIVCLFILGSFLGLTGLLVAAPVVAVTVQLTSLLEPGNLHKPPSPQERG
jgi:predicted PurR-regulated permease PerM